MPKRVLMRSGVSAQVHCARLHSGEAVVVKVQRPGLSRLFDIDLAVLAGLAAQLDAQEEGRDFTGIYNECAGILRREIDYIAEGRNANRCRHVQPRMLDASRMQAVVLHAQGSAMSSSVWQRSYR